MVAEEVQKFLDSLKPLEVFQVRFIKRDGTERTLIGVLDPEGKEKKNPVPVMELDPETLKPLGWKSFRLEKVLEICKV